MDVKEKEIRRLKCNFNGIKVWLSFGIIKLSLRLLKTFGNFPTRRFVGLLHFIKASLRFQAKMFLSFLCQVCVDGLIPG